MGYQEIFDGVRDALQRHRDDNVRDEFAMAALTGLCAGERYTSNSRDMAEVAYLLADAMFEARKE